MRQPEVVRCCGSLTRQRHPIRATPIGTTMERLPGPFHSRTRDAAGSRRLLSKMTSHTQTHLTSAPGRDEGLADRIDGSVLRYLPRQRARQGGLGDCWLVSAFAAIAENASSITGLCAQQVANVVGGTTSAYLTPPRKSGDRHSGRPLPIRPEAVGGIRYEGGPLQFTKLSRQDEMWPCTGEGVCVTPRRVRSATLLSLSLALAPAPVSPISHVSTLPSAPPPLRSGTIS